MARRRPRSGTVYAKLRLPSGTPYEAAFEEAKPWGEQFPGAHVRLEIGNDCVIDVPFPTRGKQGMATIYREFFQGVRLGCRILIPALATVFLLLALR